MINNSVELFFSKTICLLELNNIDFRIVEKGDFSEIIIYPDNFMKDKIEFSLCQIFDNGDYVYTKKNSLDESFEKMSLLDFILFSKNYSK